MSDYQGTLAATSGKNLGKLHEELSTARAKAETFKGLAASYKREADEAKDAIAEALRAKAAAEHRARALEYALRPIVERANAAPVAQFLPVEWHWINEATAILGSSEDGPRLVLREFATALERTLIRNDDKPDWGGESLRSLMALLRAEVDELGIEVAAEGFTHTEAVKAAIRPRVQSEALDVAAFAMMIWAVAGGSRTVNRGRELAP